MAKAKNKKDNFIVAYFKPFGIKQICDILLLVGTITAIVGAFTIQPVLLVGLIVFLLGNVCILVRNIMVLKSKINHRSPEYRSALSSLIIMSILFVIAVFALIYSFVA